LITSCDSGGRDNVASVTHFKELLLHLRTDLIRIIYPGKDPGNYRIQARSFTMGLAAGVVPKLITWKFYAFCTF